MLAIDQAHLYGNHIQVHGNHLRLSDLEWGSLDIVELQPLMIRNDSLIREAHENAGVQHYGCVIERDFGFDPDMIANIMVSKNPRGMLKVLGWVLIEVMGSRHIPNLYELTLNIQHNISRDECAEHNIATMNVNGLQGIRSDREAKERLKERSELIVLRPWSIRMCNVLSTRQFLTR